MQSSVLTGSEEVRRESQEQNEVDHGDFEMVVSKHCLNLRILVNIIAAVLICRKSFFLSSSQSQWS